ncbi:hypothetical protein AJ78_07896 [Emergomyces pasteurianus Ep9510]|uniref:Carbonic anhydrase n=1 Tax=Emergomyces pasteurianus Ep9510 TaxID=1447872 RepID=A0A1J9P583_9EURO|nr:hypothetical protein AJ78_07896 [Emergomyces pasteurianus Ep9510]
MLPLAFGALVLLNARSVLSSCAHGTYLHRRVTDGDPIEALKFGYGASDGPTNWHALSPDFVLCGIGRSQSPIDIGRTISQVPVGYLSMDIPIQDVKFENLGTTVEVLLEGKTVINGREYLLQQFHFHVPSEHVIYGEQYAAEIHFVHAASDNNEDIAVVALMVQATSCDSVPSLNTLISNINQITSRGSLVDIRKLNATDMASLINSLPLFSYTGSLTTPPCTEGIPFYILSQAVPMHIDVLNSLKTVIGHNSRFLQNNSPTGENSIVAACRALPPDAQNDGKPAAVASPAFCPGASAKSS